MRKRGLLVFVIFWVVGILFPMAFLGKSWPAVGKVFDLIFSPGWMHILMHALLYTVLGFLLALWIPPRAGRIIQLSAICLMVGVLHEAVQLLTAHTWPGWMPELFDLGVDLGGSAIGISLGWLVNRKTGMRNQEPK